MKQLAEKCSRKAGCPEAVAEKVIEIFLESIAEELSQGNTVDLGVNFGVFSIRLREVHLAEDSPRTGKSNRYKVVFREGRELRKRLKVNPQ